MAATTTQPNNVAVKFRGHGEREMASTDNPTDGASVVKAAKPPGVKRLTKGTRKRAKSAMKRGLISETAMKKIGSY